jgi:hypothetical protein
MYLSIPGIMDLGEESLSHMNKKTDLLPSVLQVDKVFTKKGFIS